VRVDMAGRTRLPRVAMKVDMADVTVALVRVERQIGVRARARLVVVFVGMGVDVAGTVTVGVEVNRVGVVVVTVRMRLIGMRIVEVILIAPHILVIAMVVVEMIRVRDIPVVIVRRGGVFVVVIAMLHIPVVPVRWMLVGRIEVAGAGRIAIVGVIGRVGVVLVQHPIEVIGMPGVGVVIEQEIAVNVGVITVVGVGVSMIVEMRYGICMVTVRRPRRVEVDIAVINHFVLIPRIAVCVVVRRRALGVRRRNSHGGHERGNPAGADQGGAGEFLLTLGDAGIASRVLRCLVVSSIRHVRLRAGVFVEL
jgi:hypothetical protein